jgi:hypothetical protein
MSAAWQTSNASLVAVVAAMPVPSRKARCRMTKSLAIIAGLKAVFIAASAAFARGDMLPVILISILFNLVQLGAKPAGQSEPTEIIAVSRSHEEGR